MKDWINSSSSLVAKGRTRAAIRACVLALTPVALLCPSVALADFGTFVSGFANTGAGSTAICLFPDGNYGGPDIERYQTNGAAPGSAAGFASASNPCAPAAGAAVSHASAGLGVGQLKVYASAPRGANDAAPPGTPPYLSAAAAHAAFWDDVGLFLHGLPVSGLANGLVGELRMDIHGGRSAGAEAYGQLDLFGPNDPSVGVSNHDLQGGESFVLQFRGPFHFIASLGVDASDGEIANFSGTGTLSISLPEGYTFGSGSGVLLADVGPGVPAIPEPETYALMLAGLGLMGFAARRRLQRDDEVR